MTRITTAKLELEMLFSGEDPAMKQQRVIDELTGLD